MTVMMTESGTTGWGHKRRRNARGSEAVVLVWSRTHCVHGSYFMARAMGRMSLSKHHHTASKHWPARMPMDAELLHAPGADRAYR